MTSARHIAVLLTCLLAALPLRAEHLYFDATSGFGTLGSGEYIILKADRAPAPARFLTIPRSQDNELTVITQIINRKGGPSDTGTFRDPSGKRQIASRPGLTLLLVNEAADTMRIHVSSRPLPPNDLATREAFMASAELQGYPLPPETEQPLLTPDRHPAGHDSPFHSGKPACITLRVNPEDRRSRLQLFEGDETPQLIWESGMTQELSDFLSSQIREVGFGAMPGGELRLLRACISTFDAIDDELLTAHDADSVKTRLTTSRDPMEGYWELLDYTTDDTLLRSGGRYICALIADSRGGYKLIYLSGAERNDARWTFGRIKARMSPTRLPSAFRATWYDADGQSIDPDCEIRIDTPRILSVQFPHLGSTLRMHKIPPPELF